MQYLNFRESLYLYRIFVEYNANAVSIRSEKALGRAIYGNVNWHVTFTLSLALQYAVQNSSNMSPVRE